jgi:hypothetical protein
MVMRPLESSGSRERLLPDDLRGGVRGLGGGGDILSLASDKKYGCKQDHDKSNSCRYDDRQESRVADPFFPA